MDKIKVPRILVQTSNNGYRITVNPKEDEMIYSSVDAKRGRGQIVVESVRNEEQGRKITRALVNALSWKIEPRHKGIEIRNSPTFIVK